MPPTLNSQGVLKKITALQAPKEGVKYLVNRNPRNLERLRIAYRNEGYWLEKDGRSFWHKLNLTSSGKYVTATLEHFQAGPVVEASTKEWAIKKQLFRTSDTSAYINLARIFAQRCLEAGLNEMRCDITTHPGGRIEKFLKTLEENGLTLKEADIIKAYRPSDRERPEKPWEVTE